MASDTRTRPRAAVANDVIVVQDQLSVLVRRARRHAADVARAAHPDLDPATSAVLLAVSDGSTRASELAARFGVDKAAISRQLGSLERLGLVERVVDERDARAWRLSLTRDGVKAVRQWTTAQRRAMRAALSGWPEAEIADLAASLTRLNAALER